jgi:pSer/pThr/pTyr-binding forkhead associated (FHA) protein
LLGEDVLSRKIPDRGKVQHRQATVNAEPSQSSPDLQPVLNVPADAPRVLAAVMISYEANPLGQAWMLHQGSNLVGRAGAAAGADLELPHATVSSKHALFMVSAHPGRIVVTDFGSTNGTFVNDTALPAHEPRELRDGDRIRFGLFPVIVKII